MNDIKVTPAFIDLVLYPIIWYFGLFYFVYLERIIFFFNSFRSSGLCSHFHLGYPLSVQKCEKRECPPLITCFSSQTYYCCCTHNAGAEDGYLMAAHPLLKMQNSKMLNFVNVERWCRQWRHPVMSPLCQRQPASWRIYDEVLYDSATA